MPDPLAPSDALVGVLAASLAPRYRLLSVAPRGDVPYQVDAVDLLGVLRQFGFVAPVLLGERFGALTATLAAAWYPELVAGLVLVDARLDSPLPSDSIKARALRDCPPAWSRLESALICPLLELPAGALDLQAVEAFLDNLRATVR